MKKNDSFATLKQIIDGHDNLLITSHILPDGDNIGSTIAMALALKRMGKNVMAVGNGEVPARFRFLAGADELVSPEEARAFGGDLVIALDISDRGRIGTALEPICEGKTIINIDHHISNDYFGDYNYVDAEAAATAEIVASLLLSLEIEIDRDIAASLYTGLLTDSGSFTFTNTTAHTLSMASYLLTYEPDLHEIRSHLFGNMSLAKKRLLGYILTEAKPFFDGAFIYCGVDASVQEELNVSSSDFEGAIDQLMEIARIKIAAVARSQAPGEVKVSLRAKPDFDAVAIAAPFGGGGHRAAAGCTIIGSLAEAEERLLAAVKAYLEERR